MNNSNDIFDDDHQEFSPLSENLSSTLNDEDELEILYNTEELRKVLCYICNFLSPKVSPYVAFKILNPKN